MASPDHSEEQSKHSKAQHEGNPGSSGLEFEEEIVSRLIHCYGIYLA